VNKTALSFLLFFALAAARPVISQHLVVIDRNDDRPLPGATVQNLDLEITAATDSTGACRLDGTVPGHRILVSFVGFESLLFRWPARQEVHRVYLAPAFRLLDDIVIRSYEGPRKLSEIAGSFALLRPADIRRFQDESLVRSMNTLPGIRMEERSPSSYRLSIRGSLLRAPFGVRNVKIYWNEIPFTDPTGSTPLYSLDLNNIDRVEVIKGPAGSLYGAGTGGVVLLQSERTPLRPFSGDIAYSAGSYGYHRVQANVNTGGESHRSSLRYARQSGNGYREHTSFRRETVQWAGQFYPSPRQTVSAQALYSDLFYQTPGGLTRGEFETDPRQARPIAIAQNASIDQQLFLAGISHDYQWSERSSNITSVYVGNAIKENPFTTNYEIERLKSYGLRSRFHFDLGAATRLDAGVELQHGRFHATNYGNRGGFADTLRYEDRIIASQALAFFQADRNLSHGFMITLGASINYLRYDIDRLRDVALDTSYQINRVFRPVLAPRIGLLKKTGAGNVLHASISYGFSPPTTDEVRTSDGGINEDLQAEKGINYEAGFRGNALSGRLLFDVSVFYMNLLQTIVSRTDENNTSQYENSGKTNQFGAEALFRLVLIDRPAAFLTGMRLQFAYTWHHFRFREYIRSSGGENVDFSGNALTGTAPHIAVAGLELDLRPGFFTNINLNATSRIPLNDANTEYGDAYQLLTWKAGWRRNLSPSLMLELNAGVDNLLDQRYSLGNDLNAFGGRYFNASPERNYFGGLKLSFQ
jgi:iron complex outermembrane recepter protein